MTKNRILIWICGAMACGCATPREFVYVDVNRAIAADSAAPFERESLGSVPFDSIQVQGSIPAAPGRTIADAGAVKRLADAQIELARQREEVIKNIGDQLLKSYAKDIDRYRLEQNAEIEKSLQESFEAVSLLIGEALQDYADKRWPAANRLALLVGFPFPSSAKIRKPDPEDRIATKRYLQALDLYAQLKAFESEFQADVESILKQHYESASQKRLELGLQIVEKLDEAEKRAHNEATKAIASINQAIDVSLINLGRIRLEMLPAKGETVVAATPLSISIPGAESSVDSIISPKERVEQDLRIWLGANKFRLAKQPAGARDLTENFINWRRTMRNTR